MSAVIAIAAIVSVPGLAILLFGLAAVDRVGLAAHRRWGLPWRRAENGRPMVAASVEEMHAAYDSAKRHDIEQKQTLLMLRDSEDDGAPPRSQVDLDNGTAVIHLPHPR